MKEVPGNQGKRTRPYVNNKLKSKKGRRCNSSGRFCKALSSNPSTSKKTLFITFM
jgi:hypothetical protein